MRRIIIAIMLCMLAACVGTPSTPTSASTSNASSAPATPAADQMSVLAPTATDQPILPSATGEAPPAASDEEILCIFTQGGGLIGATETVTVLANGQVTAERDRPTASTGTTQATPQQLAALRTAIDSGEWQRLQARYGRPIPDGFTYQVQCGGVTVTTYDGAERPTILDEVIQQLGMLRQQGYE